MKNKTLYHYLFALLLGFFSVQVAQAQNTVTAASSTPTVCINNVMTNITHTTTVATGIGTATNLPAGVTAAWASDIITISGTPSASGVFNYSIPLTGGSGSVNATGTITVAPSTVASTFTGTTTVCPGLPTQFSGANTTCSSFTQSLSSGGTGTTSASLVSTQTNNITIEEWVKLTSIPSGTQFLFYNGNTGGSGYGIAINNLGQLLIFAGGVVSTNTNLTLTPGIWQHVALVRNAGFWYFYLNGVQQYSTSSSVPYTPTVGTYVGNNNSSGEIFNGKISQVAFWNTVRTTAQIQADMQACSFSGSGLAAYWSLNGTANDLSGNGNNLTLSSTTYSTDAPPIQTGAQYVYDFGDGSSDTSKVGSATRTYTAANTYTVSLTVTNACTTSTSTQSITVNPTPAASISGLSASCGAASVTLTASGGTSYSWTEGSSLNTATNTISTTSTPTVTVTNTFGCSATASKSVTIAPNTVAGTISADQSINFGSVVSGTTNITGERNTSTNATQSVSNTTNLSQSFIPSVNAPLFSISLSINSVTTAGSYKLEIISGSGNSGTVLSNTNLNITSSGIKIFNLPSGLSIISGTTYTIKLSTTSSTANISIRYSRSNPYPNGQMFQNGTSNNSNDLYFSLTYRFPNANWSNLTLTGHTGTVKYWEQSSDDNFTNPTQISSTSSTLQSIFIGNLNATTYFRAVVQNFSCDIINTNKVTITVNTNTTWNGTSWSNGAPTSTLDAIIASSTAPASFTCKNLTINSNSALTTTDITATVHGNIINNGNGITGTGYVTLAANSIFSGNAISFNGLLNINGSTAQTLNANSATVQNLIINNAAGVTLTGAINLTGVLTPTAGVLTTGGFLTLKSFANNSGSIASNISGSNYISGNVTVERFISGQSNRGRWRFLSTPISNATVANWMSHFFVTGPGDSVPANSVNGSTLGTLNTFGWHTNMANISFPSSTMATHPSSVKTTSVRTYNETVLGGVNTGWENVTSSAQALTPGKGFRAFIRGDKNAPNAANTQLGPNANSNLQGSVNLTITGTVNQGEINANPTFTSSGTAANDGWNLLGNPYACSYNLFNHINAPSNSAFFANINSTVYVYSAITNGYVSFNTAGSGTNAGLDNGIVPPGAAFFIQATAANPVFKFQEAYKTTSSHLSGGVHKTAVKTEEFGIKFYQDSTENDYTVIKMYNGATLNNDMYDIVKVRNDNLNLAAYGTDSVNLTASVIPPIVEETRIKLNVEATVIGTYHFDFTNMDNFEKDLTVNLFDRYTNKTTDVRKNTKYTFEMGAGVNQWGNNRFELILNKNTTGTEDLTQKIANTKLLVYPNPATDVLNINISNANFKNSEVVVYNISGAEVLKTNMANSSVQLNIETLSNGVYFVKVTNQNGFNKTVKFVK